MRALVVEDDPKLQQQIQAILDKAGFAVDAPAAFFAGVVAASGFTSAANASLNRGYCYARNQQSRCRWRPR